MVPFDMVLSQITMGHIGHLVSDGLTMKPCFEYSTDRSSLLKQSFLWKNLPVGEAH